MCVEGGWRERERERIERERRRLKNELCNGDSIVDIQNVAG